MNYINTPSLSWHAVWHWCVSLTVGTEWGSDRALTLSTGVILLLGSSWKKDPIFLITDNRGHYRDPLPPGQTRLHSVWCSLQIQNAFRNERHRVKKARTPVPKLYQDFDCKHPSPTYQDMTLERMETSHVTNMSRVGFMQSAVTTPHLPMSALLQRENRCRKSPLITQDCGLKTRCPT